MAGRWTRGRTTVLAHVQTWRPYTTSYPALLGLAGAAWAADAGVRRPAVAAGAAALGWLSGHYLGDWFDRGLDAIAKPQRPIPSGRLSADAALVGGVLCATASAVLVVAANWAVLPLFLIAMAGIVGYSRVFKKRGLSGNVSRGALTALAVVIGAMIARPAPPWSLLPVAAGLLLHDTASNLVGTVRDVDGDREGGYRSVPVRHGVRRAVRLALSLYAGGLALVASAAGWAPRDAAGQVALLVVAAGCGAAAFVPLLRSGPVIDARSALRAHEVLVAERLVLAAAVLAGARGVVTATVVLLPVLLFSLVTQKLMRAGHEFPPAPAPLFGKDPSA
ncbi:MULTISPECIES: UbiA family prenyltransferase [Streptomyces]|jgi:4-hydroxybenzoate polyprenyltransferase/geranylgeranylglycerol-phosphate geranylgeranyltransferase|uniref:UbiA family prenyltransferase n=1 Tax=Streptomyces griseoaurantiacus TaxID=68213 RepID=A0ABZ1VEU8_9ACTN|nr:UbiA family prenyltransferase [Streptomyces jietaisiensis]